MALYTVKPNQNIFDIALHLYGTIEGLFDLLITNPRLNMTSDLITGMQLEYHPDFVVFPSIVTSMQEQNFVPANGERHVYLKQLGVLPVFIIQANTALSNMGFVVGGEGTMIVDWGDNSDLEYITLTHNHKSYVHYYDNQVDLRRVKIYGDFALTYLDTSDITGNLLVLSPVCVDEYVNNSNGYDLNGLFLFEGTYSVNLQHCDVDSLASIGDMSLMTLDLRGVKFSTVDVLDDYLEYVVANHADRRACTVYLTTEPSERGMTAIQTIINEEDWNTPDKWKFIINETIYTAS